MSLHSRRIVLGLMLGMVYGAVPARAGTLFFDNFNGPQMSPVWQASLPTPPQQTYIGAPPSVAFQTLDGASVLRLDNALNNHQEIGWSTTTTFDPTSFRLDVRFNTLVQSSSTSIDGFLQTWLIDASQPSRYLYAYSFEGNFSSTPTFNVYGTIDSSGTSVGFTFQNNTWYHLVIEGSTTQDITAAIYADNDTTELVSYTLDYNLLTAFPDGFRIGLGQAMGSPNRTANTDVAIDSITLTGSVPEPAGFVLFAQALVAGSLAFRRRSRPWRTQSGGWSVRAG